MKHILSIFLLLSCFVASAQLEDGRYVYSNSEVTLEFSVGSSGWELSNVKVTDNRTNKTAIGSGEWRAVNSAGSESDSDGWYEFQTQSCNYSFDAPEGNLLLEEYDCKNGRPAKKHNLTRRR